MIWHGVMSRVDWFFRYDMYCFGWADLFCIEFRFLILFIVVVALEADCLGIEIMDIVNIFRQFRWQRISVVTIF